MNIEEFSQNLPSDLKIHLDMIAQKLAKNHASLMVGAGFSKNANKISHNVSSMPSWKELKEKLEYGLYKSQHTEKSVLQLAEEYETVHGSTELENFIKNNIADKSYAPGKLHKKLLSLPWRDVFTTNYDTLLERAYQEILAEKKYSVVTRENQLTNCESDVARIIKLHGSLPYDTPFVLTEEHYRRYPDDHAIFVNTVQQSLIENTLCLIGFSGTDPNFIKWTGWIRDNLCSSANPIYLIDCREFSMAERNTLKKKNIIVINLCDHPEIQRLGYNERYKEAYGRLFDYLGIPDKLAEESRNWPCNNKFITKPKDADIKVVMQHWEMQRKLYPNWFILPLKHRETLRVYTKAYLDILKNKKLDAPNDLIYGYELFWRNKKCLFPLFSNFSITLEKTLLLYNPFPTLNKLNDAIYTPTSDNAKIFNWEELKNQWVEMVFAFIQDSRQEMREKDFFNWTNNILTEKIIIQKPEWEARWHYEKCLFAMAQFDITSLEKEYNCWPHHKEQYAEQLWRANILCELGKIEEAEILLETTLASLRRQTNQMSITSDFYLIDIENYLLFFLKFIKDSIFHKSLNDRKNLHTAKEDNKGTEEIRKQYNRRWEQLRQYDCYFWNEIDYFEDKLNHKILPQQRKSYKVDFFSSNIRWTNHFSSYLREHEAVLTLPIFLEEAGIPLNLGSHTLLGKKTIQNTSEWLMKNNLLHQGVMFCIRRGMSDTEELFPRIRIAGMRQADLDDLLNLYIKATEKAIENLPENTSIYTSGYAVNICKVLPSVIGRLCIAASSNIRKKVLKLAMQIYNLPGTLLQNIFQSGTEKLWKGLLNYRNDYEIADYIKNVIKLPVFDNNNVVAKYYRRDPILLIEHILEQSINKSIKQSIAKDISLLIDSLKTGSLSKATVTRLVHLCRLDLLSQKNKLAFSRLLWNRIDPQNGLPQTLENNVDIVISLPAPGKAVNPLDRYKGYLLSLDFPLRNTNLDHQEDEDKSFTQTGNNFLIAKLLLTTCSSRVYNNFVPLVELSPEEATNILNKIITWWNRDKSLLKGNIFASREFRNRFLTLPQILAEAIIPVFRNCPEKLANTELKNLLNELKEYDIPRALPLVASLMVNPRKIKNAKDTVITELFSRDFKTANFAYMSVTLWLKLKEYSEVSCPPEIIETFINMILNRDCICKGALIQEITYIVSFLDVDINIDRLCLGLKYLLEDTDFCDEEQNENDGIEYERRPYFRLLAAKLAYAIYQQLKVKKKSIPPIINQWKTICNSSLLPEIRNQWKE
jgi:hypothetical protein